MVQKYVERPLTIKARKFDIRLWVLVTSINPLVVWHYSDFYLRFSSRPYSADDLAPGKEVDLAVHLTNQCIQKQCDEYGADDEIECNMWSSAQMEQHLHAELGAAEGAVMYERVVAQMLAAVSASMRAVCDVVEGRAGSHELFGFDFMLDETYGV